MGERNFKPWRKTENPISRIENDGKRITMKEMEISYIQCTTTAIHEEEGYVKGHGEKLFSTLKIRGLFLLLLNMRSSHFKYLAWEGVEHRTGNILHMTATLSFQPSRPPPQSHYSAISKTSNFFPFMTKSLNFFLTTFIFSSAEKRTKAFMKGINVHNSFQDVHYVLEYWIRKAKRQFANGLQFHLLSPPIRPLDLNFFLLKLNHIDHMSLRNGKLSRACKLVSLCELPSVNWTRSLLRKYSNSVSIEN